MARRRNVNRKLPLEWVYKYVAMATKATVYTDELDLDLLPDEIAEIWSVDTRLSLLNTAVACADDISTADACLSMDPDAKDTPATTTNLEDLEVFYSQSISISTILDGAAASAQRHGAERDKQWVAVDGKPILVGTNVGIVGQYDTSADMYTAAAFEVRLYFSRRRASAPELNQILLKRR